MDDFKFQGIFRQFSRAFSDGFFWEARCWVVFRERIKDLLWSLTLFRDSIGTMCHNPKTSCFRFSTNTISKTHFFPLPKKHSFNKKVSFWFWAISAETTILIFCPGFHCFGPKKHFGQNRLCARKCAFFLPSWHRSREAMFAKNSFFSFSHIWITTLKHYFYWFIFAFSILLQQHKNTNT